MSDHLEVPSYGPLLRRLRERYIEAEQTRAEQESASAPRFNVFSLLGVGHLEVKFHSPFLRNLLDPYGDHGQGAVFLREFVAVIASRLKWNVPVIDDFPSPDEWVVRNEVEKIDLILQSTPHKCLLFIENKINAPFRSNQMKGYRDRLDKRNGFAYQALILLAPKRYDRSDQQTKYAHVVLTYEDDIVPLLTRALDRVRPEHVRGTIRQYIAAIHSWGESDMAGELNDLGQLLMERDNLALALDIEKILQKIKQAAEDNFWNHVEHDLQDALKTMESRDRWAIVNTPDKGAQRALIPVRDGGTAANLKVGVFHEKNNGHLTYGVSFLVERNSQIPTESGKLRSALFERFGKENNSKDDDPWWLYYRESGIKPQSKEFFLAAQENAQQLAGQFTGLLRDILKEYGDELLAADLALG